jgi:hypothetical protein
VLDGIRRQYPGIYEGPEAFYAFDATSADDIGPLVIGAIAHFDGSAWTRGGRAAMGTRIRTGHQQAMGWDMEPREFQRIAVEHRHVRLDRPTSSQATGTTSGGARAGQRICAGQIAALRRKSWLNVLL